MTFNINTLSRGQLIAEIVNSEIEFKQNLEFLLCDYFATFSIEDLKGIFIDHELHLSHIHADSYIETENTMRGSL
jgi:hypothetical protein